eukprot:Skav236459  [mRNA]  locus=scaffold1758:495487:500151:- [translate_table: standard]
MLVRLQAPGVDTWILVAHAPHGGIPEEQRAQWWHNLCNILATFRANGRCIVCIDANATTGRTLLPHIFDVDDDPNHSTDQFVDFLIAADVSVPATDSRLSNWQPTWTSPDGRYHRRIDYVLVPSEFHHRCHSAATVPEVDLTFHGADHILTVVGLAWSTSVHPTQARAGPRFDKSKIGADPAMEAKIATLPQLPWNLDVASQHTIINAHMRSVLEQACPVSRHKPNKSFLSPEAWDLRKQLILARKNLKTSCKLQKSHQVRYLFQLWAVRAQTARQGGSMQDTQEYCVDPDAAATRLRQVIQVRHLVKRLKTAVKECKQESLQTALAQCRPETPAGEILRILRPYRGSSNAKFFGAPPLPMVEKPNGEMCCTPEEAIDRWVQFFADMEGGVRVSEQALQQRWCQELPQFSNRQLKGDLTDMPPLVQLEGTMRRVKPRKAIGPDMIPGELCHFQPAAVAAAYYPLLVKTALFGMEPLAFKGGRLTTAWKRKGSQSSCMAYRSLLISSHPGKAIHRALRDTHVQEYERALKPDQLGGRVGTPVTLAMQVVRSHQRVCAQTRTSYGVVFLDLKEAFYRTLRELAIGSAPGTQLHQWIAGLGLPLDTVDALHAHLSAPSALDMAGFSPLHRNMVQALHNCTWFHVQNQTDRVLTSIGSRPGDCYADWVFSMLFARVLQTLESKLASLHLLEVYPVLPESGLCSAPQPERSQPLLGPIWMDDLALLVSAPDADELISKIGKVLSELLTVCLEHGMQPNTTKGKTEVLVHLTGPGSKEWRKHLFNKGATQQLPVMTDSGVIPIHVTPSYRHLGGMIHHTGDGVKEIRHRFGQAHQALGEHQRLLFSNPKLQLSQKKALLESLVLSKLLYGVETIVITRPADQDAMESALHKLYKRVLRTPRDAHVTRADVLVDMDMPNFATLHRRARLRFYGTAVRCSDGRLWGLFNMDRTWKEAMLDDLVWMWQRLLLHAPLPDPRLDLQPWHHLIRTRASFWKKLIARAVRLEVLHHQNNHVMSTFYHRFGTRLQDLDILRAPPRDQDEAHQMYGCMQCGFAAKSKAGEAVHLFKVHNIVAAERHLFDSTQCRACLQEFHTGRRIQLHLRASARCREQLTSLAHVSDPLPGVGSRQERALQERHDDLLPTLQAQGPHPRPRRRLFDPYDLELFELIMETMLPDRVPWTTADEVCTAVRAALQSRPFSWTATCTALRAVCDALSVEEADIIGLPRDAIRQGLLGITSPDSWPFLRDGPCQHRDRNHVTWQEWEETCQEHVTNGDPVGPHAVPRPFSAHRVLLHLFSGRRRFGDIQDYLERAPPKAGTCLHVISIDIIFHPVWGDLAAAPTQRWWIRAIRHGWIVGMLAGPPCSTWSQARGRAVEGKKHAPRVIRTASEPWGISQVAIREILQLLMGNKLLVFCLEALLELWWMGGTAVLEHPACPADPQKASIWRTLPIQVLARLPGFARVLLHQGHYGAKSPKPTHLLVLNMPYFESTVQEHMVTEVLPVPPVVKESPPAMNHGMATAFSRFMQEAPVSHMQIPPDFWQATSSMEASFGLAMGLDCPI